jgi:cbb3-type cytochrome oxidase cytochrome c subunit
MKYGPIIGAGAMFSLACSWAALVMAPQLQLGALAPAPIPNTTDVHPATRPGLAAQGVEVYRSLGCQQCHTRQVRQTEILFGARLNDIGTNAVNLEVPGGAKTNLVNLDLLFALAKARPDLAIAPVTLPPALAGDTNVAPKFAQFAKDLALFKRNDEKAGIARPASGPTVNELAAKLPAEVLVKVGPEAAERAVKLLTEAGGKAELVIYNLGPDIERGWGARRSVARDFVNDTPVLLGSVRVGPDLAGIGSRAPEKFAAPWKAATTNLAAEVEGRLLAHLYNPRLLAKDSICPSASYLFDTKKPEVRFAGEPLLVPGKDTPVYPRPAARALVAFLLTQRADIGLPEAPTPAPAAKNAPAKP